MRRSPCKSCDRHKKEFPDCLDKCKTIDKLQMSYVNRLSRQDIYYEDLTSYPIRVSQRCGANLKLSAIMLRHN